MTVAGPVGTPGELEGGPGTAEGGEDAPAVGDGLAGPGDRVGSDPGSSSTPGMSRRIQPTSIRSGSYPSDSGSSDGYASRFQ
jgi:hypothetical protein